VTRRPWRSAALLALACAAAWGRILANDFAWDDGYLVVGNPAIQDLSRVPDLFVKPWAAGSDYDLGARQNAPYFRPVALASMALDWAVAGPDPLVFHGTNLLVHLLSVLALWAWLRRVLGDGGDPGGPAGARGPALALGAALLWAIHPVHSEAVCLVTYRTTLLSGLFVFASLVLLTPFARPRREDVADIGTGRSLLGAAAFAAGLLSKETTAIVPALLLAFDAMLGRLSRRRVVATYLPLGLVGAAWWIARSGITGADIYTWFEGLTPWQSALMVPRIFYLYVRLALVPWPLCPFYDWSVLGTPRSLLEPDILAGALLLGAMAAGVFLLRRRAPLTAFGLAWAFVALLPVSHLMPFFDAAGERFLYVPLAGWVLAGAGALAAARSDAVRRPVRALAALAMVAFLALSFLRAGEWHDSESALRASVRDFPQSVSAQLGLGRLYLEQARPAEAVTPLAEATRLAPSLAVAHALKAVAEARAGELSAARATLLGAPRPQAGLPSAAEIARMELQKAGLVEVAKQIGLGL
jgi:protein O-mannosyl-transferase